MYWKIASSSGSTVLGSQKAKSRSPFVGRYFKTSMIPPEPMFDPPAPNVAESIQNRIDELTFRLYVEVDKPL